MKEYIWAWHIHHHTLVEPLTEPIEARIAYIKANKPADEITLRLRLLKKVNGALPKTFVEAWGKAEAAHDKPYSEWGEAEAHALSRWAKTFIDALPEISALHSIECVDCPWDGMTIFVKEIK